MKDILENKIQCNSMRQTTIKRHYVLTLLNFMKLVLLLNLIQETEAFLATKSIRNFHYKPLNFNSIQKPLRKQKIKPICNTITSLKATIESLDFFINNQITPCLTCLGPVLNCINFEKGIQSLLLSTLDETETFQPNFQSALFNDLDHVLSEFLPFLTEKTSLIRFGAVVGRIFEMYSDYLDDNETIPLDDLLFQISLLLVSMRMCYKSFLPRFKSYFIQTSDRDKLVYDLLFEPVGIEWYQFKGLIAEGVLDWVDVEPHYVIVCQNDAHLSKYGDRDVMFWQLSGDIELHFGDLKGYEVKRTHGKDIEDPSAVGLIGDMRFLYELDSLERMKRIKKGKRFSSSPCFGTKEDEEKFYPKATFKTGQQGATMMRVKGSLLLQLMEHDEELTKSIKLLLFKSLQRKVGALLRSMDRQAVTFH